MSWHYRIIDYVWRLSEDHQPIGIITYSILFIWSLFMFPFIWAFGNPKNMDVAPIVGATGLLIILSTLVSVSHFSPFMSILLSIGIYSFFFSLILFIRSLLYLNRSFLIRESKS